jgi:hypothetical protein
MAQHGLSTGSARAQHGLSTGERHPGSFIAAEDLGAGSRAFGAAHGASWGGPGLGWSEAQTDRPILPPWISPPADPISFWGHQRTSGCLGAYLSSSQAHLGPILCPCAMTRLRAMRGGERADDPGHLQTRLHATQSCRRPSETPQTSIFWPEFWVGWPLPPLCVFLAPAPRPPPPPPLHPLHSLTLQAFAFLPRVDLTQSTKPPNHQPSHHTTATATATTASPLQPPPPPFNADVWSCEMVRGTDWSAGDLAELSSCTGLATLDVSFCPLNSLSWAPVQGLTRLRAIWCVTSRVVHPPFPPPAHTPHPTLTLQVQVTLPVW